MHVLVTGGAGFIGSHVVDQLVAGGHRVRVLDALASAVHDGPPTYLNPAADLLVGNLTEHETMTKAVAGIDAVCHLGARVGLGVDIDDIDDYVSDNDLGTAVLLRALWRSDFRGRLVVASSIVVYGEGRYRCDTCGPARPGPRRPADLREGRFDPPCPSCGLALAPELITEDAPLDPRSLYAATKLQTEQLAAVYGREGNVPTIALRYHNVYGPRMSRDSPYSGVTAIFRSAYERGRAPDVFEDGNQRRDFIHVADAARATVLALTAPPDVQGPFNVASGEAHTVHELAGALHRTLGAGAPAPAVTGEWRLGDVRHILASPARARQLLGFEAAVPFEAGIREFATAPLREPSSPAR